MRAVKTTMGRILARASVAIGFLVALAPNEARAQSWTRPPLIDHDAEAEEASEFWSSVISGSGEYEALVAKATNLSRSSEAEMREEALAAWQTAAKLRPREALPHYSIGMHHMRLGNHAACARALRAAYEIEPRFVPEQSSTSPSLRLELGTCLLFSNQYEDAIPFFQSLIAEKQSPALAGLRLGEALMALGRLDESIFALEHAEPLAASQSRNLEREVGYALAVALDRAERLGESRELLGYVLRRDSQLTTLRSTDKSYAPESEEQYYLGLAYEAQGNALRSIYHFRRYIALAPTSPWRTHAQSHIDGSPSPPLAEQLSVSGSAQWQIEPLRKAIRSAGPALSACVAGHPQILATITLSGVLTRPASKHQARAAFSAHNGADRDTMSAVVECLESAARRIRVPKQSGLLGGHGSAEFSILGSPE